MFDYFIFNNYLQSFYFLVGTTFINNFNYERYPYIAIQLDPFLIIVIKIYNSKFEVFVVAYLYLIVPFNFPIPLTFI
jgi:hypothetical protein